MAEIWKPVPGYEGYFEVSTYGRVKSLERYVDGRWKPYLKKEKILVPHDSGKGYLQVKFSADNKRSMPLIHRLVAKAFIPNPENLPQINHKDGNPRNNHVDNLEWCTASGNALHRCHVLNHVSGRPQRPVICLDTGKIYKSSHEAAREMEIRQGSIFSVCQGKWQRAGGYRFAFV